MDHLDHWRLRMGMDGGTLLENTGNATEYYVAQPERIINRLIDPCEDLFLRSDLEKKDDRCFSFCIVTSAVLCALTYPESEMLSTNK